MVLTIHAPQHDYGRHGTINAASGPFRSSDMDRLLGDVPAVRQLQLMSDPMQKISRVHQKLIDLATTVIPDLQSWHMRFKVTQPVLSSIAPEETLRQLFGQRSDELVRLHGTILVRTPGGTVVTPPIYFLQPPPPLAAVTKNAAAGSSTAEAGPSTSGTFKRKNTAEDQENREPSAKMIPTVEVIDFVFIPLRCVKFGTVLGAPTGLYCWKLLDDRNDMPLRSHATTLPRILTCAPTPTRKHTNRLGQMQKCKYSRSPLSLRFLPMPTLRSITSACTPLQMIMSCSRILLC